VAAPYGTLAERMAVPGAMHLALPPGSDPVRIAGGLNPGLASWLPLTARAADARAPGVVMVLGTTGMAGLLAIQNALILGAERVIGAGRAPAGLERAAAAGATAVALTGDRDRDSASLAAGLDGHAPGIVLDFLWGGPAEAAFAAPGRRGLGEDSAHIGYVQIGAMAGPDASVPASLLRSRRLRISGSGAGSASVADVIAQLPGYMELIASGRVQVPTRSFPLSHVAEAWAVAAQGLPRAVIVPG
jgi:NADPH:quinone reductase-like Zn-dependent oxidoreductase